MILTAERVAAAVDRLPMFPPAVHELLRALDDGVTDTHVLEQMVMRDPEVATRTLRVASSPFWGLSGCIRSIREACIVLGVTPLRNLVLTSAALGQFAPGASPSVDHAALWQHSLAVGVMAGLLAELSGGDAEVAFTSGLLHDVGKLVLDVHFPREYAEVARARAAGDLLLRDAENAVLGFDHALVSGLVVSRWRLPAEVIGAAMRHHERGDGATSGTADLVHVADVLVRALGIGSGGDDLVPTLSDAALERLGIGWSDLEARLPSMAAMAQASAGTLVQ